jgi:hypothetical protein
MSVSSPKDYLIHERACVVLICCQTRICWNVHLENMLTEIISNKYF